MAKLGLSPQQIEAGIAVVMHSNFKKIGSKKDSEGKQLKPDNWQEIEAEQVRKLQAILDKRAYRLISLALNTQYNFQSQSNCWFCKLYKKENI